MPSLLAAAGVPKSERDYLGRWSPSGSDDYVRTYRAVVRTLARRYKAAVSAKKAYEDLDEEDAVEEVAGRIKSKFDVDPDELDEAKSVFKGRVKEIFEHLEGRAPAEGVQPAPAAAAAQAVGAAVQSPTEELEDLPPLYVLAHSGRSRKPRLHLREGCYQARGLRFKNYELLDMNEVPMDMYGEYCRKCWPAGNPTHYVEIEDEEADTSSSDSASTSSEGP